MGVLPGRILAPGTIELYGRLSDAVQTRSCCHDTLICDAIRNPILERTIMSFGIYIAGFAILLGGLVYGAHLLHMPSHWIAVGAFVLIGAGIMGAVKATRQKDPAN
jgi:hypothetical protein